MKKKYLLFIVLLLVLSTKFVFAIDYNNICGEAEIRRTMVILGTIIQIIKILVPCLIIFLGILDFFNAMMANDDKAINKATSSLVKRLISGVIIFFIPTIILYIVRLVSPQSESGFTGCTTCLLHVSSCR